VDTALPISAAVPMGARRMIHHKMTWMTLRKDSVKRKNGSAASPAFTAAMPMAREITSNCEAATDSETPSSLVDADRPMKFSGTMDWINAVHEPTFEGSAADAGSTVEFTPGRITSATKIPTNTEKKAVMANHTKVDTAKAAAFATLRRLATEVTTAAKISGGTITRSSCT